MNNEGRRFTPEKIGQVELYNGDILELFTPDMGQYLDTVSTGGDPLMGIVKGATGLEWEEFRQLPVTDGLVILGKLGKYLKAMSQYIEMTK